VSEQLAYTLQAKLVPWGTYVSPKAEIERTIVMRERPDARPPEPRPPRCVRLVDGRPPVRVLARRRVLEPSGGLPPPVRARGGRQGRPLRGTRDAAGFEQGQKIAYIFDFGDEWRINTMVSTKVNAMAFGAAPPVSGGMRLFEARRLTGDDVSGLRPRGERFNPLLLLSPDPLAGVGGRLAWGGTFPDAARFS
jgi:hypothetical protein